MFSNMYVVKKLTISILYCSIYFLLIALAVNSEVQTIMTAVPLIDLRALSRVQYGTIRRKGTPSILKVCITRYLANDLTLRKLLLDQMKSVSEEIEVEKGDDTMKKIMDKFEEKSKLNVC